VIPSELVLNESSDHEDQEFPSLNKFPPSLPTNPVAPVSSLYGTPHNQHLPIDYEERNPMGGAPVSPISVEGGVNGQVFGIQTGSQSLESTLSDEKKFKQIMSDMNMASTANNTLSSPQQQEMSGSD
jgi:hypothetical protein